MFNLKPSSSLLHATATRSTGLLTSTKRAFRSTSAMIALALGLAVLAPTLHAQATRATALRKRDLQVGGYFVLVPEPDYTPHKFYGGGGYATYDFYHGIGVELNFRQANTSSSEKTYERTYQVGARYVRHYGIVHPYVRVSYGRGVFNFPNDAANLAYNMYSIGGGADFAVARHINLRGDYEYQGWHKFPPNGLNPQVLSIGAAYHF